MNPSRSGRTARPHQGNYRELTAHQRAAQITILLWHGSQMTTTDVAKLTYMSWGGAKKMMDTISLVLPITQTDGLWHWMEKK
jgi:hypothetical protein